MRLFHYRSGFLLSHHSNIPEPIYIKQYISNCELAKCLLGSEMTLSQEQHIRYLHYHLYEIAIELIFWMVVTIT